jgi:hypothetical protein
MLGSRRREPFFSKEVLMRTWTKAGLLTTLLVASTLVPLAVARTDSSAVDPEATRLLKQMTDYMGGLKQFSLRAINMVDEVLVDGQKIQYTFTADILIRRPDGLRVERTGDLLGQHLIYDGSTLSVYESRSGHYASIDAPDNIDDLLHFARDVLDIVPPTGDMVFTNAYDLLTTNITSAGVVGKSTVDGVRCDHLAFTSPLVD